MRPVLKIVIGGALIWWLLRSRQKALAVELRPALLPQPERATTQVRTESSRSLVEPTTSVETESSTPALSNTPQVPVSVLPAVATQSAVSPRGPKPVRVSEVSPPAPKSDMPTLRSPTPEDASSQPVLFDPSTAVVLDDADVLNLLTPGLRKTVRSAQPTDGSLPFDSLSKQAKDVLLRGYAADYVAKRRLQDDAVYDAAVFASTKSGLPVGWTQALAEQGVQKDALLARSVEVVRGFDKLLVDVAALPGEQLDLKTLRDRALSVS